MFQIDLLGPKWTYLVFPLQSHCKSRIKGTSWILSNISRQTWGEVCMFLENYFSNFRSVFLHRRCFSLEVGMPLSLSWGNWPIWASAYSIPQPHIHIYSDISFMRICGYKCAYTATFMRIWKTTACPTHTTWFYSSLSWYLVLYFFIFPVWGVLHAKKSFKMKIDR